MNQNNASGLWNPRNSSQWWRDLVSLDHDNSAWLSGSLKVCVRRLVMEKTRFFLARSLVWGVKSERSFSEALFFVH